MDTVLATHSEDWSLDQQHPHKSWAAMIAACNPSRAEREDPWASWPSRSIGTGELQVRLP